MTVVDYRAFRTAKFGKSLSESAITRQFEVLNRMYGLSEQILTKPFCVFSKDEYTLVVYTGDNLVSTVELEGFLSVIDFSVLLTGALLDYGIMSSATRQYDLKVLLMYKPEKVVYLVVTREF
jgi:hypothetical protein